MHMYNEKTFFKRRGPCGSDPYSMTRALHAFGKQFSLSLLIGAILVSGSAWAQTLPSSIRLIVPFTPSGPVDYSARLLAEKLRTVLGIPVVAENRPGANGAIAAVAVKQAPPDGATLLYTSSGMLTISPHLDKNLPYDALRDFAPVTTVVYADTGLVVGTNVQARNLKELVELAQKSSGKPLAFGSAGTGNITHGLLELFKESAKIDLLHVPYKGAGLAVVDVLSGQLTGMFIGLSLAQPHVKAGKLRVLGITGSKRSALDPDIPTFSEQGYAGIDFVTWTGIMAPRSTPPETIKAILNGVARALGQEDTKAKLLSAGMTSWLLQGDEFTQAIKTESASWKRLITEKNITTE